MKEREFIRHIVNLDDTITLNNTATTVDLDRNGHLVKIEVPLILTDLRKSQIY